MGHSPVNLQNQITQKRGKENDMRTAKQIEFDNFSPSDEVIADLDAMYPMTEAQLMEAWSNFTDLTNDNDISHWATPLDCIHACLGGTYEQYYA